MGGPTAGRQINGPKPAWAAAIAVNVAGPLAYFRWGRRGLPPRATG